MTTTTDNIVATRIEIGTVNPRHRITGESLVGEFRIMTEYRMIATERGNFIEMGRRIADDRTPEGAAIIAEYEAEKAPAAAAEHTVTRDGDTVRPAGSPYTEFDKFTVTDGRDTATVVLATDLRTRETWVSATLGATGRRLKAAKWEPFQRAALAHLEANPVARTWREVKAGRTIPQVGDVYVGTGGRDCTVTEVRNYADNSVEVYLSDGTHFMEVPPHGDVCH